MGLFESLKPKSKPKHEHASSSTDSSWRHSSSTPQNQYTGHRNISTSNLSTTSTLTGAQTSKPLSRMTSYEAFLHQARIDAERKEAREYALRVAAQRRLDSSMWPAEPWRGGFGMPVSTGVGGQGVEGWLSSNGLRK